MGFVDLVERVAGKSGMSRRETLKVIHNFIELMSEHLTKTGDYIRLPGLGSFYLRDTKERVLFGGTRKSSGRRVLKFRECRKVKKELAMEKYGVVIDDEKVKTAGDKKTCPKCGGRVYHENGFPKCEKCGTEPFEKKPEGK